MKKGIFFIVVLLLLMACDNKQTPTLTSPLGGACAPLRGDPNRLEELLRCLVQHQYEPFPAVLGEPDAVCRVLPAAVKFIHSARHDDKQNQVLFGGMMSLPLTDYLTTWAPAVKGAYLKGNVEKNQLPLTFFPYGNRVDMYLAYDAPVVQLFYSSLLKEPRIADVKIGIFPEWDTIGKHANAILNGEATKVVKIMIERGELGYTPKVPDLATTCATLQKPA